MEDYGIGEVIKNRQLHVGINKHGENLVVVLSAFDPNDEIKF